MYSIFEQKNGINLVHKVRNVRLKDKILYSVINYVIINNPL